MSDAVTRPPVFLKQRSSTNFILFTICLALFTDGFLYAVVIPTLPFVLVEQSGVPEEDVQKWSSWMLSIFGGATLLASPLCGWMADNLPSRRIPLLVGLSMQAGSTVLYSIHPDKYLMLAARGLQGLSAAVIFTVGLALLVDTVGHANIGRDAGMALSSANLGVLISPPLGGFVYKQFGYYGVVIMMVGLVIVDIFLRLVMIEKKHAQKWLQPDPVSPINGDEFHTTYGTMDETNAKKITGEGDASSSSSFPPSSLPSSSEESPLIAQKQEQGKAVAVPLFHLLKTPRIRAIVYGTFVSYVLLSGFDSDLPVFVKLRFHWDSFQAGIIFLGIALPSLGGPIAGFISDRIGAGMLASISCAVGAICTVGVVFVRQNTIFDISLLCVLTTGIGAAINFVLSPIAGDLALTVEKMEEKRPGLFGPMGAYAQAFSLFNCAIAAGTVVGPLWTGLGISQLGWGYTNLVMGAMALSAAIVLALFVQDRPLRLKPVGGSV
ncbi:hypothetical protein ASPZODRAFT_130079 [Penicilliopsis zonata CBS 506.65]|uniref:Major facilitator superfamily (MFS) profile domain-containing protein n=1 Tax=Penicilliopsis zonata CBS 506.65 TaxID=1073090 RepID=A0A1L9SLS3_9EURO|nr:hypothetical protein ASPZODRAFT_130079 [Penicilliopsis zonata CBS 506.65]OJJ48140.1 hypothetical protein ASPZODRAFT_130079 [Penicilliopsis zonata CBS 506.65]